MNPTATTAESAVPPTREFSAAWIGYGLMAVALFMWWPALIALLICYVRRDAERAGIVDSHYRWIIATFWIWTLLGALAIAAMAVGVLPLVRDVVDAAHTSERWAEIGMQLQLHWDSVFAAVGFGLLGGLMLAATWFWVVYRIVRGGLRLADGRAVP